MTRVRVAALVAGVAALGCVSAPQAVAQAGMLPRDLAAVAQGLSCESVRRFFDRPGMVDPPYLYGVEPGEKDKSAAFWCERPAQRSYLLVVWREGREPTALPWTDYPGGLALSDPTDWDLSQFRRVDDLSTSGPRVSLHARRALQSSYDGVIVTFLEHGGVWYFRLVD